MRFNKLALFLFGFVLCITLAKADIYYNAPTNNINSFWTPFRGGLINGTKFISEKITSRLKDSQLYGLFRRLYNKTWPIQEIPRRLALYSQRKRMIEASIGNYNEGKTTFVLSENKFIDWEDNELRALLGTNWLKNLDNFEQIDSISNRKVSAGRVSIPAHKDWSKSGCDGKVRDQENCGACYAFATLDVVATQNCLKKTSAPVLSVQQVVDCSSRYGNEGCNGGWPTRVFKYLQDEGSIQRDVCYSYRARRGICKSIFGSPTPACEAQVGSPRLRYKILNNERDILHHVATTGPVVTALEATDNFLMYGKGIFDDPKCRRRRNDVDHAISIVGYGRENNNDYWIIKNSWGEDWGEKGYGRVKRGKNACSIGTVGWAVIN